MRVPTVNGFYVSPGTVFTAVKRSIQSRFGIYKRQPPLPFVGGQTVINSREADDYLSLAIAKMEPFAAGRLGTTEGDLVRWRVLHPKKKFPLALILNGKRLSGIFPTSQSDATIFSDSYLDSVGRLDLLGVRNQDFFNGYFEMERIVVEEARPQCLCSINVFSPLGQANSWVKELKGKRVLVIHPFAKTIKNQYEQNKRRIYPDPDWLPDFDLFTYRPFQTAGDAKPPNSLRSWSHALDLMLSDCSKIKFDIALIGAGAFGLPLATGIKQSGRVAIHIGGDVQAFFGIRGGRWDIASSAHPHFSRYDSDAWVRPSFEETPKWSKSVEGGAYW